MNKHPRNPYLATDIIIEMPKNKIVLIKRKNPPHGWALPGGFVEYGESVEAAAVREAKEETSLDVTLLKQLHTYSKPDRDPRQHIVSVVFIASASGEPKAADDAKEVGIFDPGDLPPLGKMAFDHRIIIRDYLIHKETGEHGRFTL